MNSKRKSYSFILIALFPFLLEFSIIAENNKVFCATYTDVAPQIDADLSDPCWGRAEKIDDFVMIASPESLPAKKTIFQVLYSETHLYLAVECWIGDVSEIKSPMPKPGIRDQYTSQYSIEIFIDPQASYRNYYQIAWSVNGMRYDGLKMYKDKLNGSWTVKTKILKNKWISELAIPLSDLMNSKPFPGTKWGFNICRNDVSNYSIWKNTGGSFHDPEMYGEMVIGGYEAWWNKNKSAIKELESINYKNIPNKEYVEKLLKRTHEKVKIFESKKNIKINTREEFLQRHQEMEILSFDLRAIKEYISYYRQ